MANLKPTEAELEILGVLWKLGKATVRKIYENLGDAKPKGYTTTLKHVQIMFGKGMLARVEIGRAHEYTAKIDQTGLLRNLLDKAFGGSQKALILKTLQIKKLPSEDAREIRKLLKPTEKVEKPKAEKVKTKKPKKEKKKEKPAKKSQAPQQ